MDCLNYFQKGKKTRPSQAGHEQSSSILCLWYKHFSLFVSSATDKEAKS